MTGHNHRPMNDPQDDMTMFPGSAPEAIADQQRQHREQTVDNSLAAGGIGEGAVFDGYVIEKKLGPGRYGHRVLGQTN